jgi:hypothetical protein
MEYALASPNIASRNFGRDVPVVHGDYAVGLADSRLMADGDDDDGEGDDSEGEEELTIELVSHGGFS